LRLMSYLLMKVKIFFENSSLHESSFLELNLMISQKMCFFIWFCDLFWHNQFQPIFGSSFSTSRQEFLWKWYRKRPRTSLFHDDKFHASSWIWSKVIQL